MTKGRKKERKQAKKESKNWAKKNENITYLDTMTLVSVMFNDGRKYDNIPLTEKLDKLLTANKKRRK